MLFIVDEYNKFLKRFLKRKVGGIVFIDFWFCYESYNFLLVFFCIDCSWIFCNGERYV